MKNGTEIREYLEEFTGPGLSIVDLPRSAFRGLPLHLSHGYKAMAARLFGRDFVLMAWEDEAVPTPGKAKRDLRVFRDHFDREVVLVMNRIPVKKLRRFREARIPYVVPGQHLFLPTLLLEQMDYEARSSKPSDDTGTLAWSAQVLLLRHLLFRDIEGRKLIDLSTLLGYSPMSMSIGRNALASRGLCETTNAGRLKDYRFTEEPKVLWARSLPFLRSPVKRVHLLARLDAELPFAALSALSRRTDLGDDPIPSCATDSGLFGKLKAGGTIALAEDEDLALVRLEEWHYDPQCLTTNDAVDPLSLYLSLKESPDERVQIALNQLMESFQW